MWETRVVIPKVFHEPLLKELHCSHVGMSRMKSLAHTYFWWPHLDSQIEELLSRNCVECSAASRNPPKAATHPWIVPQHPWQQIHVDHAYKLADIYCWLLLMLTPSGQKCTLFLQLLLN